MWNKHIREVRQQQQITAQEEIPLSSDTDRYCDDTKSADGPMILTNQWQGKNSTVHVWWGGQEDTDLQ